MPHNILGLASVGPIVEAGNERLSVLGSLGVTGQSARVRTSAGSPEKPHAECGRPHLMREIGTDSSMSGDGKRGDAAWPRLPRPSSTLFFELIVVAELEIETRSPYVYVWRK